ncbi:Ger(x)C family spore germination protein [Sporosarcina koreensis]|uniref:Ger(X)C family spore germination protein n=1 Tax=Sporosarcina koreensis TaxID=334735 RepID=A0ABW0TXE9_9BACL
MKKRFLAYIPLLAILLGGCWDEAQYKDITIVPVMGLTKNDEGVKALFTFPTFVNGQINYSKSEGKGISTRDARDDANHRTMEALDLSHLEVLLISSDIAKQDVYEPLDAFFRSPRNRITSYLAVVEGDMEQYFNPSGEVKTEVAIFYPELLRTAVLYTYVAENTLGETAILLLDDSMDLSLPYMILNEMGVPTIEGIALFSNKKFTGKVFKKQEAVLASVMKKKLGKYTRLSFDWKEKNTPITIEVINAHRKINISNDKVELSYTIDIDVAEFPKIDLYEKKVRKEAEKFLASELKGEFEKIIKTTQEAKSDIIGIGRKVHAFHQDLWKRGDWHETYATLPIDVKVKVNMKRTNIIN